MKTINTELLKTMFMYAAKNVAVNSDYIDELNIFPVPDGDTGTNMKITISGACDHIANITTNDIASLTKAFAYGLLLNARGNSGVILSQIFKGFSLQFVQGQEEITIKDLIDAFTKAKENAYKAVSTPIEGTILTVIREVSEKTQTKANDFLTIEKLFDFVCSSSNTALQKTPDLLPELKEANVVDSGAFGLNKIFEGMKQALSDTIKHKTSDIAHVNNKITHKTSLLALKNFVDDNNGFGYCCEFIMKLGSKVVASQPNKALYNENDFKEHVSGFGDSFVYARDDDLIKVHLHTIHPYKLLEYAAKYGEFNRIKIENMTLQFIANNPNQTTLEGKLTSNERYVLSNEVKLCAIVPTDAIEKVYSKQLNVDNTFNCFSSSIPSTQQIFSLLKETKSKNIILITNNGNEIMSAKEAINLIPRNKSTVYLLPAKDIATSYLLALAFDPNKKLSDNYRNMFKLFRTIVSGKIAKSVKEIAYKKVNVKVGDYIGIFNDNIIFSSQNMSFIIKKLVDELFDNIRKPKHVVVIYGSNASLSDIKDIEKYIYEEYGKKPIMISGQQSIYYFCVAISR